MRVALPSLVSLLLIFIVVEVKCEWNEYHEPRLVKIEVIDERGHVRAKMMEQRDSKDSQSDSGGVDDEDSPNEGSGDSDHQHLSDVAHDEPIPSRNDSKVSVTSILPSPSSSVTTSNSFGTVTMTQNTAYSTSIITSTKSFTSTISAVNPTPALASTTTVTTISSSTVTNSESTTQSKTADVSSTAVVILQVTTEAATTTTTQRPTTIELATQPNINKSTTSSSTVISTNDTKNETVDTVITPKIKSPVPTSKTTEQLSVAVKAHGDPTEKPRKTLFGFVTVEILIALLAGALFSILLVAFLVYRLKKRNEGSYELSETIALRNKELDEMSSKKEVFV